MRKGFDLLAMRVEDRSDEEGKGEEKAHKWRRGWADM